jgi:AhpD family alkylhydroperoxidase
MPYFMDECQQLQEGLHPGLFLKKLPWTVLFLSTQSLFSKMIYMEQRMNPFDKGRDAFKAFYGIARYLSKSPLEERLLQLIYLRVSQINGCAYCLDMHSKDLRAHGETEQRLYVLNAWREAPFYSERERAALAWAEALTRLGEDGISNSIYKEAIRHFSDEELIDLTFAVVTINGYNRINIAFKTQAGAYQPGQHAAPAN